MSANKTNMKLLYERRDRLLTEVEAARARLDEVEGLIRAMGGEVPTVNPPATTAPTAPRVRRGDLKEIVLDLYEEAGEAGLSTAECIAAAEKKRGVAIQPASVSSLLSRLKGDGILIYDGSRYRLKRFAGPRSSVA